MLTLKGFSYNSFSLKQNKNVGVENRYVVNIAIVVVVQITVKDFSEFIFIQT